MALNRNRHLGLIARSVVSVTGTTVVKTGLRKIDPGTARVGLLASVSTDADKASVITWLENSPSPGDLSIFCWKATNATTTTLIAATAAVNVGWSAIED